MRRRHDRLRQGSQAALLAVVALGGCVRRAPPPAGPPKYVVGPGYQLDGSWFYPKEDFHYDATGIASVAAGGGGVTADNEAIDPGALTAAHQTLQLPCVARVTNLENGLSLLVRVNDRGPSSPARVIALSRRAAALLEVNGAARVRVQVEEGPSAALREQLQGGPLLRIAAAPRTAVVAESLAPPAGVAQSTRRSGVSELGTAANQPEPGVERVPDRLPETVTRGTAQPGQLVIRAGSFGQAGYARQRAALLAGQGARTEALREGRTTRYEVLLGPYGSIPAADAALDQVRRAGVSDARIEVE